jgi:lipopolysaccharide transport system ATP-binding protein
MGLPSAPIEKGETRTVVFSLNLNLMPENYSISLGVGNGGYSRGSFLEYLLVASDVKILQIVENSESIIYSGYYNMKPTVDVF